MGGRVAKVAEARARLEHLQAKPDLRPHQLEQLEQEFGWPPGSGPDLHARIEGHLQRLAGAGFESPPSHPLTALRGDVIRALDFAGLRPSDGPNRGIPVRPSWWVPTAAPKGTVEVRGPEGTRRYTLLRQLSAGNAGSVALAKSPEGAQVVVKTPKVLGGLHEYRFWTEAEALRRVNGAPQLPGFHGVGTDASGQPALVLDFVEGEEIKSTPATRGNVGKSVRIAMEIGLAVQALNDQGLRHGDLTYTNVMIKGDASKSVKVIDLGMAQPIDWPYEWGGALYYAPEQNAGLPSFGRANGDMYSVGAHLLHLLTGLPPTLENLAKVPDRVATLDGREIRLRHVISSALDPNPLTRPQTMGEWLDALRPFASTP